MGYQAYNSRLKPFARQLRKDMTKQERHLWYDLLRTCSVKFQRQKPLGPYIADFYCHQAKLVVEVDGGQHFEAPGRAEDQRRDAYFAEQGISVLRFSNLDIDKNFTGVCTAVMRSISPNKECDSP